MTWIEWYDSLTKPSWTPDPATISLIWTVLYPVILVSFGFVFVQALRGKLPRRVVLPFAVNLVANLLFMPIFAGLRGVPLAAADIVVVWASILWCVVAIWPHYRWVAVAQVPYFVWVSLDDPVVDHGDERVKRWSDEHDPPRNPADNRANTTRAGWSIWCWGSNSRCAKACAG